MKVPQFSKIPTCQRARRFQSSRPGLGLLAALTMAAPWLAVADDTIKSKVVDAENNSVTETISDAHGKLQKKTVLYFSNSDWYDKGNYSTGAVHYSPDNTIRYKESFKRDSNGVMQQTWLYSKDDKILGHRVFHYDATGKLEHIDDYDANGQILVPRATPVSPSRPDKKRH